MLYVHIGIASMRQIQCVSTTYVTEKKVTMFEFTLQPRIMSICFFFASFKHLKLSISIIIPVTIQQIVFNCMTIISPNSIS